MHDLLRLFARGTCHDADDETDREAAEARLVGHYADLAGFVDSCVDPELRPAAAQDAEQAGVALPSMREALAIFQAERSCLLAAVGLAAMRGWDEQIRRLAESTADSLRVLRYLDDLLTVMEAALAAARHTGDTRAEGQTLNNLGEAYRELRRFGEAIGCYEQSLVIKRENGDGYGEGQTLANLGNAYQEMRQRDRAAMCWREAVTALCDAGDHEEAGRVEQLAASAEVRRRRWRGGVTGRRGSRLAPRGWMIERGAPWFRAAG